MQRIFLFIPGILGILFFSCNGNETGNSRDINPDAVFLDYKVWTEEDKEEVTVHLQFRMDGPEGTPLILHEPSKVTLDGELIPVDSARLSGAYYEAQKPAAAFAGRHTIVFTDGNGKEYREDFEFIPFKLSPDVPPVILRGDIVFNFSGLEPVDHIRVLMTDTSFTSDDMNEIDTVRDGRMLIHANKLSALSNGPINLQFYKEIEKPVKNSTKEGGTWFISYGIKREFVLIDPVK